MNIGLKIKQYRKSLGLTQTELGKKLGVKKNAVSKWECGRVDDIPTTKLKAMAEIFNISLSSLIGDYMEEKPTPATNEGGESELVEVTKLEGWIINAYREAPESLQKAIERILTKEDNK